MTTRPLWNSVTAHRFGLTGDLRQAIADLPDDTEIQIQYEGGGSGPLLSVEVVDGKVVIATW